MQRTSLTIVALMLPLALAAQTVSVQAELALARRKGLPEEPILRRVDATRVRGASDREIAAAARRARLSMEVGVEAMVNGGHQRPTQEEIERCAAAMEQGYTRSQVQTVAASARPERSLAVAFDVLTRLSQRGLPVSRALDQVTQKLKANESDESLMAMLNLGLARRP